MNDNASLAGSPSLLRSGRRFAAHAAKDITVAVASTFTTTDPYDANDTLSQAVAKSFYQGLYGFDKDMKMVPVLAESYTASKDGLVYTVKLKSGIKFHDNTPFNAEAVKATFDRVTNPTTSSSATTSTRTSRRPRRWTRAPVRFTLKEPFSPFINTLAHPSGVIISPAALAQVRQQGHRAASGGHRPVQVRRVEGHRLPEGREVRRLLAQGLPEGRQHHLAPGGRQQHARRGDADQRGALRVPAAARGGRDAGEEAEPGGVERARRSSSATCR
jgi:hypothetical protein